MRRKWICGLVVCSGLAVTAEAQVFVSPSGDDGSPGTSKQPVASLAKGVELARDLPAGQPKRVVFRPGEFFDTGVTLTAADSGLTIESDAAGPALLLGGMALSGWEREGNHFWSAALPEGRAWDVRMLQVNGRFCPRARLPEEGTFTHASVFNVPWMSTTGGGWKRKPTDEELTTLEYKDDDVPADLDVRSAEVTVFHMWDESVAGISRHEAANRTLKLFPPLGHPPGAFGVQKYCLWNIKEGMTRPGQWYFDRGRARIVYWPLTGEDMAKAVAIVPTQRSIIRLTGATNVTLRNLSMAITTVPLITGGFAAAAFNGAIQLENASGATISNIRISNVAGHAIRGLHEQNSTRILDCDVSNCGAGGVYLSGAHNIVSNMLVHGVGLMFPSGMGIYGGGDGSQISHNEIYDTTYSAIGLSGKQMLIENNLLSQCMKVLHDGAAIYCFGMKHGFLHNNFVHDIIDAGGYGASSYYLDEQCQRCVVENNVSVNVARPSHNHMATNNMIRHNVFISQGDMRLTFPRCSGYRLEGNVLYAGGALTFEGIGNVASWSKNLVYSRAGKVEGTTLQDYSTTGKIPGVVGDTLVGDPQFRQVNRLDLKYGLHSPARQLGLKPLNIARAGRVGRKAKIEKSANQEPSPQGGVR